MARSSAQTQRNRVFNLLKPYTPPATGWDKVYDWLMGRARVIMIVAEIIVAITFVVKVVVDTQAKALEDQIAKRDLELKQFESSVEPILVSLQNRANSYKEIWNLSTRYNGIMAEVDSYIVNPGADILVSYSDEEVVISGEESFENLAQMEREMKASLSFDKTAIDNLDADTTTGAGGQYQLSGTIVNLRSRDEL